MQPLLIGDMLEMHAALLNWSLFRKGNLNDPEALVKTVQVLREAFPDHALLGEEGGISGNTSSDYLWCIDPLDGTTNYTHKYPSFGVSVAVLEKAEAVAGVVVEFAGGPGTWIQRTYTGADVTPFGLMPAPGTPLSIPAAAVSGGLHALGQCAATQDNQRWPACYLHLSMCRVSDRSKGKGSFYERTAYPCQPVQGCGDVSPGRPYPSDGSYGMYASLKLACM